MEFRGSLGAPGLVALPAEQLCFAALRVPHFFRNIFRNAEFPSFKERAQAWNTSSLLIVLL